MTSRCKTIVGIVCCCVATVCMSMHPAEAQERDTLQRQELREVHVVGEQAPSTVKAQVPTQVADAAKLEQTGAVHVADALRQMAGLALKDYGGVGGVKTVSARGLGSQFSTLTIDGIAVGDCQNGQVDLGRYTIGNSAFVSFAHGQQPGLLQSARAFAAGNVISMETQPPRFYLSRRTNVRVGLDGGSYGLLSPSLLLEQRLGERLSLSLWGNYMRSEGDYPFTLRYGTRHTDSTATLRRANSQMWMATADANLYYAIDDDQQLSVKGHLTRSRHNLPGAVLLYSTVKASEHSEDGLLFVQGRYRLRLWQTDSGDHRMRLQLLGKWQQSHDIYEDTAVHTLGGILHNDYLQHEGYGSATLLWRLLPRLSISLAEDVARNSLRSNLETNSYVVRHSSLTALAASYDGRRLAATANLLATAIGEEARSEASPQASATSYRRLSPFVSLSLRPWTTGGLRLRYFFKENYRVPTFSEMYYATLPRQLRPERAMQHNIGLTFMTGTDSSLVRYVALTADAYYNRVTDKIVAIPTNNMFVWSMLNMGRVAIRGLDLRADLTLRVAELGINASIAYSYQQALDRTSKSSKTYGHQIPYTPLHSGSLTVYVETELIDIGHELTLVGDRYCQQQNTAANRVDGYVDQNLVLSRRFNLRRGTLLVQARLLNMLDVQYEVVRSYPMMGRHFRLSAVYDF